MTGDAAPMTYTNFILDKSGSMQSIKTDTIGGFNQYIETVKAEMGRKTAKLTLTLFDTEVTTLHSLAPLKDVAELNDKTYQPSGMTALYDAVGQTVRKVEGKITKKDKSLVVIMTDGEENSSREWGRDSFSKLIKEMEGKGNWTFVFLGANQDAWANASKWGFSAQNVATYNASSAGMRSAMKTVADNTVSYAVNDSLNSSSFFSKADQENLENTK